MSEGSLFLAEAILHQPNLLWRSSKSPNQRSVEFESSRTPPYPPVLELGAGTGFLSIFLSQIGYNSIWSSDVGDDPVSFGSPGETDEAGGHLSRFENRDAAETRRRGPLDGLIANIELSKLRRAVSMEFLR